MKIDIARMPPGATPPGFADALTGQGGAVHWRVLNDPSASALKVIAETSRDTADYRFPICVYDKFSGKDVEVLIRFKAVDGTVDQAAGIIVRVQDADNYYVARANALEDNVRLYKVVDGVRRQIAGKNIEVSSGVWHTLALKVEGDALEVSFDGACVIEARDQTFAQPGKVGLWTKADSLTHFGEIEIKP
jgi:hypothetical protein